MSKEDRTDLDYTSLTRGFEPEPTVNNEDIDNQSALQRVQEIVNTAYQTAKDMRSLDPHDKKFTIDEQVLGYQFALKVLDDVKDVIDSTVDEINKQRGGVKRV